MSFRAEAEAVILRDGSIAQPGQDWTYYWKDHQAHEHMRGDCTLHAGPTSELIEYAFSEFMDTLNGNRDKQVLALTHCNCTCGLYSDVTVGIEGTIGEILGDVLGIRREFRW